jgi:hypothetical protein
MKEHFSWAKTERNNDRCFRCGREGVEWKRHGVQSFGHGYKEDEITDRFFCDYCASGKYLRDKARLR